MCAASAATYLPPVQGGRRSCGTTQQVQGSFVVLVPQLHLSVLAPHAGQVVHVLEGHGSGLLKDDACIVKAVVLLVEAGKGCPQREGLADSLWRRVTVGCEKNAQAKQCKGTLARVTHPKQQSSILQSFWMFGQCEIAVLRASCSIRTFRIQVTHLVRVHCCHRLGKHFNLSLGLAVEELDPLVPFMHVVRVLPQHDAAQ